MNILNRHCDPVSVPYIPGHYVKCAVTCLMKSDRLMYTSHIR